MRPSEEVPYQRREAMSTGEDFERDIDELYGDPEDEDPKDEEEEREDD